MQSSFVGCSPVLVSVVRRGLGRLAWLPLFVMAISSFAAGPVSAEVTYDFSTGVGTSRFAYKDRVSENAIPPTVNTLPSTIFSSSNYTRLVASDDNRYATGNIGDDNRAASRFEFHVNEAPTTIASLTVSWEGRAQNGGTVRLYLWNVGTSSYDLMATTSSTTDVTLSQTYTGNAASYFTASQTLMLLAVNSTEDRGLTTDYLKISVSQCITNAHCDDDNACTDDVCNLGLCSHSNNTGSCSDGNPCTVADICSNGVCQSGAQPNCADACDDCNTASCDPLGAPGNCDHHSPRPDGVPCDDELFCTTGDSCQSGVCRGAARDCGAMSDQCRNGACNEDTNACEAQPVADGTACHDERFCTVEDVCTNGVCAGIPRSCAEFSDQCNDGVCNEDSDACEARSVADGKGCDDDRFCTVEDTCTAGRCDGSPRDCGASGDQCNAGVCDEDQNACEARPVEDGLPCDDGLFCTVSDACAAGSCTGGTKDCSALTDQCNVGVCNEEGDQCTAKPVENGSTCDDGQFCTVNDACVEGTCRGQSRDCGYSGDQCNDGACNEESNECLPRPREDGLACDDALFCTVDDACTGGVCAGAPRDCGELSDQCRAGFCLEDADTCTSIPLPDGTGCDDERFCTVKDMCTAGLCGGVPRDCSHVGDQCNTGVCDDQTQECQGRPVEDGTSCDDEQFCTVGDACVSGLCAGLPRDCSASADQCNAGRCSESADSCVAEPIADGTACDDHNACNIAESCQGGSCAGGQSPNCSGIVDCRIISCDPAGPEGNCANIENLPDGTSCDDGTFCTALDTCIEGTCTGRETPCTDGLLCDEPHDVCVECLSATNCDDGVECTDDSCEQGKCRNFANNEHCPDNDLHCDGAEYCDEQFDCQSTGDPCPAEQFCDEATDSCGDCLVDSDCDDHVECTENRCVLGGCVYNPLDENCPDDEQYCNGREFCDAQLGCVSTGGPCGELEFCNEKTESCDQCRTDADCDDGDPCTVGHACVTGSCQAAHAVDCAGEGNQCNTASCNPEGATGNCDTLTPVEDGLSCDDGAYCTVNDQCNAGTCAGATRDCDSATDQCNTGFCNEDTQECESRPVEGGVSCDDGLFCTVEDACAGGVCRGSARDCTAHQDQCNAASCSEDSDECQAIPVTDGTSCDDELYCTVEDACHEGVCGGAARDCTSVGDQCNIGVCSEKSQACAPLPVADGVACNDGNACHIGESCQSGICQGGREQDCSAAGDQCNKVTCDPSGAEGNCDQHAQADDGTGCDDGVYCTIDDACTEGVCGGVQRDCGSEGNQCNAGACNELEQRCDSIPLDDGLPCDDGSYCTVNDVCKLGACGGDTKDCSALSDPCTTGTCNEDLDACEARPVEDGLTCDDGLFCTIEDVCREGVCGGSARTCGELENQCNRGVCNEESDACEARPLDDGTACDDELFCTVSDSCTGGVCTGGEPRECGDLADQCNSGVCNEDADACEALPVEDGVSCNDDLYCTVEDTCQKGVCTGAHRDCGDASDQCTAMVCSEESDACEVQPVEDGSFCDDAYECTTNDACSSGVCVSARTYGLDESNALTVCLAGTNQGVEAVCECLDLDGDGHVDLIDVAEFMRHFDGQ